MENLLDLLMFLWFGKAQGCILYPDDSIFNGEKVNRTKGYEVSCEGDDIIEEFHQKYVPRSLRKDKELIPLFSNGQVVFGHEISTRCAPCTSYKWSYNPDK